MAEPLQQHTCGYYCVPPRHAVECIALAHLGKDAVIAGYRAYVEPHGWGVVDARPAPEADVASWHAKMAWGYNPDTGTIEGGNIPRGACRAWVIWLEPQAGGEGEEDATDERTAR